MSLSQKSNQRDYSQPHPRGYREEEPNSVPFTVSLTATKNARMLTILRLLEVERMNFVREAIMEKVEREEQRLLSLLPGSGSVKPLLSLSERQAALARVSPLIIPATATVFPNDRPLTAVDYAEIHRLRLQMHYNAGRIALCLDLCLETVLKAVAAMGESSAVIHGVTQR